MKKRTLLLVALGLAPLVALGASIVLARLSRRPVDVGLVAGRLRPCPPTPNCVCSELAGDDSAWIAPLAFTGDPALAFRSLLAFLESEPNATLVDAREDYAHAVYYTSLLKFADDVELRLDPAAGVIHVRSAARIGRSDLGANRARVEDLRRRWTPPLAE